MRPDRCSRAVRRARTAGQHRPRPALYFTDTFEAFALEQGLWIAGLGVPSADTSLFSILDRATERKIVVAVSDANPSDARSAVDAAYDALSAWSGRSPRARSEVLRHTLDLMLEDQEVLAGLIAAENGKSMSDAAAEFFRWFAEEAARTDGEFGTSLPVGPARS